MQNSSVEFENLNQQFKIQTMNFAENATFASLGTLLWRTWCIVGIFKMAVVLSD